MDIAFQRDDVYRRTRRLVCFDMDSTLIEAEVIDQLAAAAGVGEQVAAITERAMQGELDFIQSFTERVALLEGLSGDVLEGIAQRPFYYRRRGAFDSQPARFGLKPPFCRVALTTLAATQDKLGIDYVLPTSWKWKMAVSQGA